jgi:hypothetical protein
VPRLDPTAPRKVTVRLHWTADVKEPWQKRKWQTVEAEVQVGEKADTHRVTLPESRPLVYFVTFTDERGLTVSSEHASIER